MNHKPRPGTIWFDRDGHLSETTPTTYVLLSADRAARGQRIWKAAAFSFWSTGRGWGGASVRAKFYDSDFRSLEYIGEIPNKHVDIQESSTTSAE